MLRFSSHICGSLLTTTGVSVEYDKLSVQKLLHDPKTGVTKSNTNLLIGRAMRKSVLGMCGQRRPRSASAESDKSLRCTLTESL